MAAAGFYAIESRAIRFGRDGVWYSDDEKITNPRIALLFSRSITRDPDGNGYLLRMGDERANITVDDTPYVVTRVDAPEGAPLMLRLNDESEEALEPSTLRSGEANVLYCSVKNGEYEARFLRPAYYQLAPAIEQTPTGFALRIAEKLHPIRPAP